LTKKIVIFKHLIESSFHFLNQVVKGKWGLATSQEKREFSQVSLEIDFWGFPTSPYHLVGIILKIFVPNSLYKVV
jgi:hypothetical protein